jgi:hypothetical protein
MSFFGLLLVVRLAGVQQKKSMPRVVVFPARMPHPNDAEPFHVLHMDPMSDVSMCRFDMDW